MTHHLNNHVWHNHHLRSDSTLHVVGVISNPARYHSRYRIAREWIEMMSKQSNVTLHIVETAFGDRFHELDALCRSLGVNHLALRTRSEIWNKECMINLSVRDLLPRDWKYLAWIDADVHFENKNWAIETIHALQNYHLVQPWQHAVDLGMWGSILESHVSIASMVCLRQPRAKKPGDPYKFGHPGFAWACTRHFWENVRGLMDFAILGSADHHMATGALGETSRSVNEKASKGFKFLCDEWGNRAYRVTSGHIGFVAGMIKHQFHGPKKRRFYCERWKILTDNGFDPRTDLVYDTQGMIQLIPQQHRLEEAIRAYNRSRFEDSIEET